jgi:hypothetical protein
MTHALFEAATGLVLVAVVVVVPVTRSVWLLAALASRSSVAALATSTAAPVPSGRRLIQALLALSRCFNQPLVVSAHH